MNIEDFDAAFDAIVRHGAVDLWAMTDDARDHCKFLGDDIDPAELQRFTEYPKWRLMPVQEICGFSIFSGADRLVRIAEQIIVAHLGLTWQPLKKGEHPSIGGRKAPSDD